MSMQDKGMWSPRTKQRRSELIFVVPQGHPPLIVDASDLGVGSVGDVLVYECLEKVSQCRGCHLVAAQKNQRRIHVAESRGRRQACRSSNLSLKLAILTKTDNAVGRQSKALGPTEAHL